MLKSRGARTNMYVRNISEINKKFVTEIAAKYGYKIGEVIDHILDDQRRIYGKSRQNGKRSIRAITKSESNGGSTTTRRVRR